jgi:hypothetical protein
MPHFLWLMSAGAFFGNLFSCFCFCTPLVIDTCYELRNAQKRDKQSCGRFTSLPSKGPPIKNKSVTPVVGGWVRGQKRTRVRFIFSIFFYRVFELPSPRNAQKHDKQKSRKSRFWTFGRIFGKSFSTRFFCNTFFVVFLNSHR